MAPPTEGEASTTVAAENSFASSPSFPPAAAAAAAASWNEPARLERNCSCGESLDDELEEEGEAAAEQEERKRECAGSALAEACTARSATTRDLYIRFEPPPVFCPSSPLPAGGGGTYSRTQRSRRARPGVSFACVREREGERGRRVRCDRRGKTLSERGFYLSIEGSILLLSSTLSPYLRFPPRPVAGASRHREEALLLLPPPPPSRATTTTTTRTKMMPRARGGRRRRRRQSWCCCRSLPSFCLLRVSSSSGPLQQLRPRRRAGASRG